MLSVLSSLGINLDDHDLEMDPNEVKLVIYIPGTRCSPNYQHSRRKCLQSSYPVIRNVSEYSLKDAPIEIDEEEEDDDERDEDDDERRPSMTRRKSIKTAAAIAESLEKKKNQYCKNGFNYFGML